VASSKAARITSGRDVRLGIESNAKQRQYFAYRSHQQRREMLLAQAVKTGIALHASVIVDHRPVHDRIDVDRAHRADVRAVSTCHTFGGIYLQSDQISIDNLCAIIYHCAAEAE